MTYKLQIRQVNIYDNGATTSPAWGVGSASGGQGFQLQLIAVEEYRQTLLGAGASVAACKTLASTIFTHFSNTSSTVTTGGVLNTDAWLGDVSTLSGTTYTPGTDLLWADTTLFIS